MSKTSFDKYVEKKIKKNPELSKNIKKVGEAIDVAFQIYDLRKKRGLTQLELAKAIGISQSNIARIERADYRSYSRQTLEKIAQALDADLNIFITPPEQTQMMTYLTANRMPTIQTIFSTDQQSYGVRYGGTGGTVTISGMASPSVSSAPWENFNIAEVFASASQNRKFNYSLSYL